MKAEITNQQAKATVSNLIAIRDAIQALGSIPAGHLYTHLMSKMELDEFNWYIDQLKSAGVIRYKPSHLIVWIGPVGKPVSDADGASLGKQI